MSLSALAEEAVAVHLARRFPSAPLPPGLAEIAARRAGGNPLFMVNLVEWWRGNGLLVGNSR